MLVIGVRHKPMKMAKTLMVLQPPFGLNNDYGCPPLMRVRRGLCPLAAHANFGFSDPAHTLWWVPEALAGANMQWVHFVYPSSSQKRESTAFDLILRSTWGLRDPVSKMVEVVLHVGKGAKFGVEEVNDGQNICSRDTSVGNRKLSPLRE